MENQIVVFDLEKESYGVKISQVESIIKVQPITAMPHAPSFVEGVINLRGSILAVIDLRKRFGLAPFQAGHDSRIIVVNFERAGQPVGIIVDGVTEVLTVPESAVEAAPAITTTIDSAFITGIAKIDQRLVILLDLERILSGEERSKLAASPC